MKDDQITIHIPSPEPAKESLSEADKFDLCHAYRECSNAMQCICPSGVDYKNCRYAQKLRNGVCFYGKNSKNFDKDHYESFCKTILNLSPEARELLHAYIKKFMRDRQSSNVQLPYSKHYAELESAGLLRTSNAAKIYLEHLPIKELREIITSHFNEKERSERDIRLNKTLRELTTVIINNCPDIVSELSNKYSYVSIKDEHYLYYFEYYYDNLTEAKK